MNQKQVGGTHYQKLDPAPWDVVIKWNLGYLEGTALKYIARWRDKGGLDDIRKAIHFLEKLVEVETERPPSEDNLVYAALDLKKKQERTEYLEDYSWPFPHVENNKNVKKRTNRKAKKD